ncbi:MAG: alpha-1,2-fucosyltransferase, partial [Burkholderiales bacterium]|nr:alpha-1,2-fucosyltransferase [Burkholderiales bacterium]
MISTRIRGGLGNQLFQYCAGRALALNHGADLSLDLRDYLRPNAFDAGLQYFNVQTVPTERLPVGREDGLVSALNKIVRGGALRSYREASLGYDAEFEALRDNTHLKGYWQSEKYFLPFEDQIRSDLRIISEPSQQNLDVRAKISACNAVSLHIRRGDYISNAKFSAAHGTCDLNYYVRAAAFVAERVDDPVIYVFSDDPIWVAQNLKLPFEVHFVDHNDGSMAHEDLRLMASCKHHIIANSSFSWWGAWLNPLKDKVVVAPTRWFVDPKKSNPDILP